MDLDIIPECYVDTNMIETLVAPDGRYNHQKGCGTVASVMKSKFADNFALGIIDKDKKELDYLNEFSEISAKGNLVLHKHNNKHHYIIQVKPAIETFMLNAAQEIGIEMKDYDLPTELKKLKKEAKSESSKNDPRFKKLFKALKNGGATDVARLRAWVEHLKSNRYAGATDALKNI